MQWSTEPPAAVLPDVRHLWGLDPELAFLNHGSFGAAPLAALQTQAELRNRLERDPVTFVLDELPGLLEETRARLAALLRADPEGLVLVPNTTTGTATVLSSIELAPGDEVVTTDHAYPAVVAQLQRLTEQSGATLVVVPVPLPESPRDVVEAVTARLSPATALLVVDDTTSMTALRFPVPELVQAGHDAGALVLVDGAHAPVARDLDLRALGADFFVGNLHKWACAPKGAAVLSVAAEHRERTRPLVASHGWGEGFTAEHAWSGTADPTAWLSTGAALEVLESIGLEAWRRHGHEHVRYGAALLQQVLGTPAPVPQHDDLFGVMAIAELPVALDRPACEELRRRLVREHRVQVALIPWAGRAFVRVSGAAYNTARDYERLAEALPAALVSLG